MAIYEATINSKLKAEDAFNYLIDLENLEIWDPGVTVAKLVEGTEVGEKGEFHVEANGAKLHYRIDEFEKDVKFGFSAKTRFFTSIDKITFTKTGTGCEVVYLARLDLNGPLSIFDSLLKIKFKGICDAAGKGLANALNGEVTSDGIV